MPLGSRQVRTSRAGRRLILVVAWVVLFDQFVPTLQRTLEYEHYEQGEVLRFENSDLFALGPLVAYMREHPRGERPRVIFFGNSVIFGYGLDAETAIPARYQEVEPDARVFNAAVNGFELGNSYLMVKALAGSIDRAYVLLQGRNVDPALPRMIPVEDEDLRAFGLTRPSGIEPRLQEAVSRYWQLYGATYRLQSALFGGATRQYLYFNKGKLARAAVSYVGTGQLPMARPPIPDDTVPQCDIRAPRAATHPSPQRLEELRQLVPVLVQFEQFVSAERLRTVFLRYNDFGGSVTDEDVADLNAAFAPYGEIVHLDCPRSLTHDGQHFNVDGARRFAEALRRHEQNRADRS